MLQWILSVLSAPVFNSIVDAYKAKLAAANTQDKLAVDLAVKEIEAEIAARAQASAIIIAEQGRWWTSMIRPLAALPVVIYIWKVVVYDKVFGLGTTDAITGDVGTWAGVIITTYFGGRSRRWRASSGDKTMQDVLTWGALIAAGGSLVAIVTFWMNRGKAEADALAKADAAAATARAALAKAEIVAEQLAEARIEFARDYASHKDLAAAEVRYAASLDSLRTELRGMNERLDRIIERFAQQA
jgi:hypothetical protein